MDNEEVINKTVVKVSRVVSGPTFDHTDLIAAYNNGAEIQFNDPDYGWVTLKAPLWNEDCEYRIKPNLDVLLKEAEEFK